jgi:hypothetical protein
MNFRKFAQLCIISKKKAPDENKKHTHFFDHVLVYAGKGIRNIGTNYLSFESNPDPSTIAGLG